MKNFVILFVFIALLWGTSTFAQLFAPPVNYTTAENTYSIVASDFNEDGYKDLAATHAGASSAYGAVFVFINNGDGTFQEGESYSAGEDPTEIVAADFDNDGDIDLAVANHLGIDITFLYNDGNGIFQDHITHEINNVYVITSIFAADFNDDGVCDIAFTDNYFNHVSVLFNYIDTLVQYNQYDISYLSAPSSVFASDLNGDGLKDLAVASFGNLSAFVPSYVTILINQGNCSFEVANEYTRGLGAGLQSIFGGDLDNDGDIDLMTANDGYLNVSVLKNNGNGTFGQELNYGIGGNGISAFITDLNGDGYKDLIAVSTFFSSHISVLLNNGDGTFQPHTDYQAGTDPWAAITADLDADGDKDIAVANGSSNNISVLFNLTNPTLGGITGIITDQNSSMPLRDARVRVFIIDDYNDKQYVTFDITGTNGQYFVDSLYPGRYLLEISRNGYYGQSHYYIVPESGVGTCNFSLELAGFTLDGNYVTGDSPQSVSSSDLDGDGDIDIAVSNAYSDDVSIMVNDGYGTYQEAVNYSAGDGPVSIFISDLDGDGDDDIVTANSNSNDISVLFNDGNSTFQAPVNYGVGNGPISIFASDLDGDGDNDLAVTNFYANNVSVLKNGGNGVFQSPVNYSVGNIPFCVYACDLDGDADSDLIVTNYLSDNVSVLKNNGDATFQSAINYAVGIAPVSVVGSDLDMDGDIDLAVANSNNVSILKNNGNGTFPARINFPAGETNTCIIASDVDGDGFNDLALTTTGDLVVDSISILLNNGNATFQIPINYSLGVSCRSVYSADFDFDGDQDLVVANASSNNISVLLNQSIITGVEFSQVDISPEKFKVLQNYPNPFNPSTKIKYNIPVIEKHRDAALLVTLKIYDVLGNEIETLINEEKQAGNYEVTWYAQGLPSGIYFYQLRAGSFVETKKMVLMK